MKTSKTEINQILNTISRIRNKYYFEKIIYGIEIFIISILASVLILSILELMFNFSSSIRTILFSLFSLINTGILAVYVAIPILQLKNKMKGLDNEEIALLIGKNFPNLKDRLRNLLQLIKQEENIFVNATIEQINKVIKNENLNSIISFNRLKYILKYVASLAMLNIMLFAIPQIGLSEAFNRIVNFKKEFKIPSNYYFEIMPGSINIVKGEAIVIEAKLIRNNSHNLNVDKINQIVLVTQQEGVKNKIETIINKANDKFIFNIKNTNHSFKYYFKEAKNESNIYNVNVIERPIAQRIALIITPPNYTKRNEEILGENIGDASVLPGSKINWEVFVNNYIENGNLIFNSGKIIPLRNENNKLISSVIIFNKDEYEIEIIDKNKIKNENPIKYKINIIPDEYPLIEVLLPNKNIDVATDLVVHTNVKISDDFGFTDLKIFYRLIHSKYEKPSNEFRNTNIPIDKSTPFENVLYSWELNKLSLVPEDVIEYYFEIFDNDLISGPKSTKSEIFQIRFPSFEEVIAKTEDLHKNSENVMEKIEKESDELKKDIDELARELKKNVMQDWQKERMIENIKEKVQSLKDKINETEKNIAELTNELQKNSLLSPETMEKYFELQKVIQEMEKNNLSEMLDKLKNDLNNLSSEEIKKSMEQIQISDEILRSSIERTISLLKKIQIEQKINELVERNEKLLESQQNIQNEKENNTKLAAKQNEINKSYDSFKEEINKLENMVEESGENFPTEELKESKEISENEIENKLEESLENLKNNNLQKALESQKKAEKGMQKLSQKLNSMQQQFYENEMREVLSSLQKSMNDVLNLSQEQENLKNKTNSNQQNQHNYHELAQEQLSIQSDLSSITNDLFSLSKKSFIIPPSINKSIGKAMNEMMKSIKAIEERNSPLAVQKQNSAMSSLNETAIQISKTMEQASQQQGGGSMLDMLKKMSSGQQKLNIQTGEALSDKNKSLQEKLQQYKKLANEQSEIRKTLEQLNKEAQLNPEKNKLLGEINDLENLMKEVETALNSNEVNNNTTDLQKKILSRMLDHQRSTQERDFEEKRESISGSLQNIKSPKNININNSKKNKLIDFLKIEKEGYSKDYQVLIKKYYEELQKLEK